MSKSTTVIRTRIGSDGNEGTARLQKDGFGLYSKKIKIKKNLQPTTLYLYIYIDIYIYVYCVYLFTFVLFLLSFFLVFIFIW